MPVVLLSQVLLQPVVPIVAARVLNTLFRRMGQPGAVGKIVAGLLLDPSLFCHFLPGLSASLFTAGAAPSMHSRLSKSYGSRVDMPKTRAGLNYTAPSYFAYYQTAIRATYCWSSRSIGYLVSRPPTGQSFAPRSIPSRSRSSHSTSRHPGALRPMPTNSPGAYSRPSTA